jgi:hypothetical protein
MKTSVVCDVLRLLWGDVWLGWALTRLLHCLVPPLCLCMYVCVYICMYVCVYIYTYEKISFVCDVLRLLWGDVWLGWALTRLLHCLAPPLCSCMRLRVCLYIYVCIYIYIHNLVLYAKYTHTHTYIHTLKYSPGSGGLAMGFCFKVHTLVHTHTHTYTYTCTQVLTWLRRVRHGLIWSKKRSLLF